MFFFLLFVSFTKMCVHESSTPIFAFQGGISFLFFFLFRFFLKDVNHEVDFVGLHGLGFHTPRYSQRGFLYFKSTLIFFFCNFFYCSG